LKFRRFLLAASLIAFFVNDSNAVADGISRGKMIFSHEVRNFRSCADDKILWVNLENSVISSLGSICPQIRGLSEDPDRVYAPVYVELTGEERPKTDQSGTSEFANEYDGVLEVKTYHGIYAVSENACKPDNRLDNRVSSLHRT
jgi:hypothetical protein